MYFKSQTCESLAGKKNPRNVQATSNTLVTPVYIKIIFHQNNFITIILPSQRSVEITQLPLTILSAMSTQQGKERMPITIQICMLCFTKSVVKTLKWTQWAGS